MLLLVLAEPEAHTAAEYRQAEGACRHSGQNRLKPNLAATHGTPDSPQDPQDHTDDHQDAPNGVQDRNGGKISDQKQNNAQNNHTKLPLLSARPIS
jgi:hypothetical protein